MAEEDYSSDIVRITLARLSAGNSLDEAEAATLFEALMSGAVDPAAAGAILMGLHMRGESVAEITGAARVMRKKALSVHAPAGAIDTCGTGGDASGSFNISTTVAFVVAGAGVPVAKHGNRAASSRSGSADVLAALGVNLDADAETCERALAEAGICFLMAPNHHRAMAHMVPVRKALGIRTIFNLLGPLANPAAADFQLVGVWAEHLVRPMAEVLGQLGVRAAWVVHGADGMDELSITGPSHVAMLADGKVTTTTVSPADAGLACHPADAISGGNPQENAAILQDVLAGKPGAPRDIVLLNAAAALVVAGRAEDITQGAGLAARSIDTGRAAQALATLVSITNNGANHG